LSQQLINKDFLKMLQLLNAIRDLKKLKNRIEAAIIEEKSLIKNLVEASNPVSPDNAIGRLTRMEAISSRGVSEASLNSAREKLAKLEKALGKIDQPGFGVCIRCNKQIPLGRIMALPENTLCVPCAEKGARE
jgi:DnaK suppressor protein